MAIAVLKTCEISTSSQWRNVMQKNPGIKQWLSRIFNVNEETRDVNDCICDLSEDIKCLLMDANDTMGDIKELLKEIKMIMETP
jgi:hypothetical protein